MSSNSRAAARSRNRADPTGRKAPPRFDLELVGWQGSAIEISEEAPRCDLEVETENDVDSGITPARGVLFGILIGSLIWLGMGLLVTRLFFV